jgi:hypothetical protein
LKTKLFINAVFGKTVAVCCIALTAATGVAQVQQNGNLYIADTGVVSVFTPLFNFGSAPASPATTATSRTPSTFGTLHFGPGVIISGASDGHHLNGYVRNTGNANFTFPVGDGSVFAPLRITEANTAALYSNAYIATNPTAVGTALDTDVLTAIANHAYWDVQSTDFAKISLSWSAASNLATQFSSTTLGDLAIAGWDGFKWTIIPGAFDITNFNGGNVSDLTSGSITSTFTVSFAAFSKFTIGIRGACEPLIAASGDTKTWSGSAWSPAGAPTLKDLVVISSPYNAGSFVCNSLVLDADVTLGANEHVEIVYGATGTGKIIMDSSASVVQRAAGAAAPFVEITKIATAMTRWDYIYFGTPIAGDFFADFASARGTGVSTPAFDLFFSYRSGFTGTGTAWQATATTTAGRGLIARVAQAAPFVNGTTTADLSVVLDGVANNGDITVTATNNPAQIYGGTSHVLLGNPYPSAIDGDEFLGANLDLDGVLYVWNSTSIYTGSGAYYQADYLAYTKAGFTAPSGIATTFNGMIPSGQGFMAKIRHDVASPNSTVRTASISFTNCMRVTDNNTMFYKTASQNAVVKDRFKVNMTGDNGVFSQILVAYLPEATLGYDRSYDAGRNSVSSAQFYSIFEDDGRRLAINARPPFFNTDVVPVGIAKNGTSSETFTFAITDKEGIFNTANLPVYLRDKQLNTYHNLNNGAFSFTTTLTTINDRFELVYTTGTLGTMDSLLPVTTASIVDGTFTVASTDVIKDIQVYDLAGRLLQNYTTINEVQFTAPFNHAAGLYIAHVSYESGLGSGLKLIHVRN